MLKYLRSAKLKKAKKIRLYLKEKLGKATFTIMHPKKIFQSQSEYQLFDTSVKIKVKLFFETLKTGKLENIKVNQKSQVPPEVLEEKWSNLIDYYYSRINRTRWNRFKKDTLLVQEQSNEIIGCQAAFSLLVLGVEKGAYYLKKFGIDETNPEKVKSLIDRKITQLKISTKRKNTDKKAEVNFYKTLVDVQAHTPYTIDIENMCLEHWIEVVLQAREKVKREQEAYNKSIRSNKKNKR